MNDLNPMNPEYEARIRSSFEKQGVMKTIGAALTKIAPGEVVIEFSYDTSLTQQHGYVHAGVVTTVVRAGRGILDTRISDELLYSGGGIPREEQGNDEETSKAEPLDRIQGEGGTGGNSRGQDAERIGRNI